MRARRHRQRALLLAAVGLLAAGIGILSWATPLARRVELSSVDARFDVRGKQKPPADVVVVGLDAKSLAQLNAPAPIPRHYHAEVIDRLRQAGAKVIAYDFQFTNQTKPDDDGALLDSLARTPGVILGTTLIGPGGGVLGSAKTRAATHVIPASTAYPPRAQRGGVFRRVVYSNGLQSFSVAAAERALGHPVDRSKFKGDGAWIDFAGPAGTVRTLSFVDVLNGRAGDLRGKVVVVGATDPILQDVHPTAAGEGMPGPEINANAIATILRDFPLRESAGWLSVLMILIAGIATPMGAIRWHGLRWLPIPIALAVAIPVIAQLAFNGGAILPVAAPGLALIVSFLGTLAVAYWTDIRERRRLRATFARFVPPQVVDEVIAQADDDLRLGGTELNSTVMFCDLRGFTSVAEHLPAEQVIDILNRYLTEMSDAILEHGGTVVSYMGDGIMAVFGAPLEQHDHADRALAAAREMLETRLDRFNTWATELGISEPFRMGIGLNSGPVMSGNVGSTRRLEYTAIGDTTNTASRLEGMTKDAGCPLLVSDTTREALRNSHELAFVGELEIRGRTNTLKAWTLQNDSGAGHMADPAESEETTPSA
ncbi:MAG TPA: CHASE2 domain-containing protein [Thermoleophilaceae bacterium]|nr:CHASE2 domain-containing protein [Thermoleophilaceae bacterium]